MHAGLVRGERCAHDCAIPSCEEAPTHLCLIQRLHHSTIHQSARNLPDPPAPAPAPLQDKGQPSTLAHSLTVQEHRRLLELALPRAADAPRAREHHPHPALRKRDHNRPGVSRPHAPRDGRVVEGQRMDSHKGILRVPELQVPPLRSRHKAAPIARHRPYGGAGAAGAAGPWCGRCGGLSEGLRGVGLPDDATQRAGLGADAQDDGGVDTWKKRGGSLGG